MCKTPFHESSRTPFDMNAPALLLTNDAVQALMSIRSSGAVTSLIGVTVAAVAHLASGQKETEKGIGGVVAAPLGADIITAARDLYPATSKDELAALQVVARIVQGEWVGCLEGRTVEQWQRLVQEDVLCQEAFRQCIMAYDPSFPSVGSFVEKADAPATLTVTVKYISTGDGRAPTADVRRLTPQYLLEHPLWTT